ncbi:MAG: pyridoxal-dependent decarboxylase [Chloroflexi bacterium]|nr:pyridoxal-dependent decarboxylase [Chloroflexota bacterium]
MPEELEPPRGRFDWHPDPDVLDFRSGVARSALEDAGRATWAAALDYVYEHGLVRATGEPPGYVDLRTEFFGERGGPGPAPIEPTAWADVLETWRTRLAPHLMNAFHSRTWGYFTPPPLFASVFGETLSQVAHQGVDVWEAGPVAAFVEEEVLRWLCDLVGYGRGSFGILTSGGVMANFIALALARDVQLRRLRGSHHPPRGAGLEGVRVYASDQAHFSVMRALDELGFPPETLVVVPSDDAFRLRGAPVSEAILRDRASGLTPLAIAAVAGSTNTGSVDRVGELADVARREGMWLHVDAAYGAGARLSSEAASRVPDLELADSVTVDPHKWMFQAYDIGGLVVRDGGLLEATFGRERPDYYRGGDAPEDRDADHHEASGQLNFYRLGFEGTRRWRALKLWLSWQHLGTSGFGRLIDMNLELAGYLAHLVSESDDFEALPPEPELSVVCFRHRPAGLDGPELDAHQDRLQVALEASGDGWLSTTRLRGSTYLRAGIMNPTSTRADVDRLLATLRGLAG